MFNYHLKTGLFIIAIAIIFFGALAITLRSPKALALSKLALEIMCNAFKTVPLQFKAAIPNTVRRYSACDTYANFFFFFFV